MTSSPENAHGPTLQSSVYFPEEFEQFRIKLIETYRQMASATNVREIANFFLTETLIGSTWDGASDPQEKRFGYRTVFQVGAIASGATSTVVHNIPNISTLRFTHMYGGVITAAGAFEKRPLPYTSATAVTAQIQVDSDDTSYRIINGATAPNILSGFLILEYLKI